MRISPLLFILISLLPYSSFAGPVAERAILEVIVNGHNEGQRFLRVTPDGDVLLPSKLLESLRLLREHLPGQDGEQVSLRALEPDIQFSLDQNNAVLHLAVPTHCFKPQVIRKEEPPVSGEKENTQSSLNWAGFLNYSVQADFSEQDSLTGMKIPWELGLNYGQWLMLTTFDSNYETESSSGEIQRQNTSLYWDAQDSMRSLTLGDFTPPYNLLNGGGNFVGISWRKNFSLDRDFSYTSDLSMETQIKSPTHAQLYSNGRQIKEWDLLPGVVVFDDISSFVNNDAELVLTDAFGREQRLDVPSFTSQQVLKKGLHEYAYSLGWQRENLGESSNDYGKPAGLGSHRYGFSDTWTGGAAFAVTEDEFAVGSMLSALLGGFSQIETGFLVSRNTEQDLGYTATARYSCRYKKINAYGGLTGFSREYVTVPMQTSENSVHYRGSLNLNYADSFWGGLTVGYSASENFDETEENNSLLSLGYRKVFGRGLDIRLGVKHDLAAENNDSIYLTLGYSPGSGSSDENWYNNLSIDSRYHETNGWENKASLQKMYPSGMGYGYKADLGEKEGKVYADARGQYKNARGIYTATARYSESTDSSGTLRGAGSVALLDGGIYQGRPITDSFAVVQVEGGVEAVSLKSNGTPVGKTGSGGTLLVPDLSSYNRNRLSVDTPNLPLNYTAPALEQMLEVKQRSGSLIKFRFTRFSAVEGNLYLSSDEGEKIALEAMPLEFTVNGERHETFTGHDGYFYLENLPTGEHLLRVRRAGGDCLTRIIIPDSDKIVSNLGQLSCVNENEK